MWAISTADERAAILARVVKTDDGLNDFEKTITVNDLILLKRLDDPNRPNKRRLSPARRPLVWRLTWRETKKLLYDAQRNKDNPDKYDCVICGQSYAEDEMDIDHRIPRAEGGSDNITNYTLTCIPCNRLKDVEYTYTGARNELIRRRGRAVDEDAAKHALQNVEKMILLISHYEDIKREVIDPHDEWMHELLPSIFGKDGKVVPLVGNDFLGSLLNASNAIAISEHRARQTIDSLINVLYAAIDIKATEEATQCQTNPKAKTRARASGSRTTQCRRRYRTRPKT